MISWHNSITARYAVISMIAAIGPTLFVGAAYDRYSSGLIDTLTGERLERRLAAISSRLSGFVEVRKNELDTLVNYPGVAALVRRPELIEEPSLRAVVELEADQPDLYGIMVFDADGALVAAIPSQAASGPPYWGKGDERIALAARHLDKGGGMKVIGPFPPSGGRPGSMLMMRHLPGPDAKPLGWVALDVRLASLTELMGPNDSDDLFQPVLLTPDGNVYTNVGVRRPMPPELLKGAQVLPGWNPGLVVAGDAIAEPLRVVRRELILITFGVIAGLIALFVLLSRHLTARVRALLDGSRAIAAGTLSWRIAVDGKDEIAAVALAFNRMAEKLEDMVRSAVESEKMVALGRFATSLAHEIRNPLSTVKTTVQALLATETQQDRREILTGVDDEIDRLDDALNDLLAYARPRPPQVARLMIWGMLDRLGAMANTLLHENKISLVKLGEPDLAVRADSGHVKQIMMNLMLNSIQAMPGGGVLTVRATRDGAMGMLEISDTGTGMSAEVLSRVTEPFFTTRADGTGLGLSISRQLTELNGGSLEIFSAVGHGTTVAVRLPLAEGER